MYGQIIVLTIWLLIGILITLGLIYAALKLFWFAYKTKCAAEDYAKKIKTRTDNKYNKYISLTPDELDQRLSLIFSQQLELVSLTKISEKDPDAPSVLYALALAEVLKYIGEESLRAIDYYYGDNYVVKFCETTYKLLENRSVISNVIAKSANADKINANITV